MASCIDSTDILISFVNLKNNLFTYPLDIIKIDFLINFCTSSDCQFNIFSFDFLSIIFFNLEKYLSFGESSGV